MGLKQESCSEYCFNNLTVQRIKTAKAVGFLQSSWVVLVMVHICHHNALPIQKKKPAGFPNFNSLGKDKKAKISRHAKLLLEHQRAWNRMC